MDKDIILKKAVKDRTKEEHQIIIKNLFKGDVRKYLLSMGEFKDVLLKEKVKIRTMHRALSDDCKEHPDSVEGTCKDCHQMMLDFLELRLMDLDTEVEGLQETAKWHKERGAYSKWGWT